MSETLSAVGVSASQFVRAGQPVILTAVASSDFDGVCVLERADSGQTVWQVWKSIPANATTTFEVSADLADRRYRYRVELGAGAESLTGTVIVTMTPGAKVLLDINDKGAQLLKVTEDEVSSVKRTGQKRIINVGAKAGGTAGWTVGAADDLGLLATLPASQTAATLVVPIPGLKQGDIITKHWLNGQIESAANQVKIKSDLRKLTAAAADVTDASLGVTNELTVTADSVMSVSTVYKTLTTPETVADGESFYVLLTATTGASTDIALQDVAVEVTEA